jgi:ribulose-phosphate 3-epimerase
MVLCMTVNPGWGGQEFLEHSIGKLERLRVLLGPDVSVEVDGGIDTDTARRCAAAGATVFVAGTAVFSAPDPADKVKELAAAISS